MLIDTLLYDHVLRSPAVQPKYHGSAPRYLQRRITTIAYHHHHLTVLADWEFEIYSNNRSNSYVRDSVLYLRPTLTASAIGEAAMKGSPPVGEYQCSSTVGVAAGSGRSTKTRGDTIGSDASAQSTAGVQDHHASSAAHLNCKVLLTPMMTMLTPSCAPLTAFWCRPVHARHIGDRPSDAVHR